MEQITAPLTPVSDTSMNSSNAEKTGTNQTDASGELARLASENALLKEHCRVFLQEIRKYYKKLQAHEQAGPAASPAGSLQDDVLDANEKLRQREKLFRELLHMEIPHPRSRSWASRLKLMRNGGYINIPTSNLGGKSFARVCDTYNRGGLDQVDRLLDAEMASPQLRANAYTAIAKGLKEKNSAECASLAKAAWGMDPKPYRLKWAAFRMLDAGEALAAEAMLDLLPADTEFSASETKRILRIRKQAAQARQSLVQQARGRYAPASAGMSAGVKDELKNLRLQHASQLLRLENLLQENEQLHAELEKMSARLQDMEQKEEAARAQDESWQKLSALCHDQLMSIVYQQQELAAGMEEQKLLLRESLGQQKEGFHNMHVAACQLAAHNDLTHYFRSPFHPLENGQQLNGQDAMLWLLELLERENYDLLVGIGADNAAFFAARALNEIGKKPEFAVFESENDRLTLLAENLRLHSLEDYINLERTPLEAGFMPDGASCRFYACHDRLGELSKRFRSAERRVLVIVAANQEQENVAAAFPVLMRYFAPASIDILVMAGQEEVVEKWRVMAAGGGFDCKVESRFPCHSLLLRVKQFVAS